MGKQKVQAPDDITEDKKLKSRRKLLKAMGITAMSMAASSVLPTSWTKPLIEFGAVPAHAQLSPLASPYDITLEAEVAPDGSSVTLTAAITPNPPTGSRVRFNLFRIETSSGATDSIEGEAVVNEQGIAFFGTVPLEPGFEYSASALLEIDGKPDVSIEPKPLII